MANLCNSLIANDIDFACDDLVVAGLEADGIIINRDDIDFGDAVFDNNNANIIQTIVLNSGKQGYQVVQQGNTPFTGTVSNLVVGTYRNTWTHEIPIAVLANEPSVAKNIIDGLTNGKFVLILRNKHKGSTGDGEYQVFGWWQGLVATAGTNEKYSEETQGGWLITLTETNAKQSATFFFNTDSDTTATAYNALLTPAV